MVESTMRLGGLQVSVSGGRNWGIGYFMAGFTEKKQALHDMLAGCLVLRRS